MGKFNTKTKHFELSWDLIKDVNGKVNIYRDEGNGFQWYDSVENSKLMYLDSSFFKNPIGYSYQIQWVDSSGNASKKSNILYIQLQ